MESAMHAVPDGVGAGDLAQIITDSKITKSGLQIMETGTKMRKKPNLFQKRLLLPYTIATTAGGAGRQLVHRTRR